MKRSYKPLLLLLIGLSLWGTAHARVFIGFPVSSQVSEDSVSSYLGLSLGTYNLWRGLGLRGNLELKPVSPLYVQGGADLLYSTGSNTVFYAGAGGGYSSAAGTESLYVSGTAGLDLDAGSLISVFAEVQPRYDLMRETGLLYVRTGLNLHFGD